MAKKLDSFIQAIVIVFVKELIREGREMKTKFFVIFICLCFAFLITALGTSHAQDGTYFPEEFHFLDPGFNPHPLNLVYKPSYINTSTPVFLIKDSLVNWSLTGSTSTYDLMQWGVQVRGLYSTLDNSMGLGNYMQGLQFGGPAPMIAASVFPTFTSNAYNVSIPSMGAQLPDFSWLNGLNNPMELAIPWQGIFKKFVPGYDYDPTKLKITSPIISDIGPGGAGHVPGQIWGLAAQSQWNLPLMYY